MIFNRLRNIFTLFLCAIGLSSWGSVTADFTASKFVGCPPLNVTFTDNSSGNPTSWSWNFGNGNTSTLQNPAATFLTSGSYSVQLTVSDGTSTDSITKTIQVYILPTVSFIVQNPQACLNDTVYFLNNSKPGSSSIVSYAWGFGDGQASSVENAAYKYSLPGSYNVTLVVQDSNGCNANKTIPNYVTIFPEPHAAFTASPLSSCNATQTVTFTNTSTGSGLSYQWSLDTNATSTLQNPTYTYTQQTYPVVLLVTDSNGCTSSVTHKVSVQELVANFLTPKTKVCTGQTVTFQNKSNFAGTSWFWNFGNGQTGSTENGTTTYTDTGTYTVKFAIYDGTCADSITKVDYIHVIQGIPANSASFSADTTISCGQNPLTVNFSNNTPGTNSTDTFLWTFGNGDTSSLQNPTETYNQAGNFTVTLTITDTNGCTVIGSGAGFIQASPPVPKFSVTAATCPGTPVFFTNKSTNAISYLWKFGDGDTSTLKSPQHTYATDGNYNVTLTAYGPGCDSTITEVAAVTVGALPASFVIQDTFSPCPPFVTIFKNTTPPGAKSYLWIFGDGYTDTTANPTHIYYYPGLFTVSLVAYQNGTCRDTMTRPNLIIVQGPTGNFSVTPKSGCMPLNVNVASTLASTVKTFYCDMGDGVVVSDSANFAHTYAQPRSYFPEFILTDYAGCTIAYPIDTITVHGFPAFQVHDTSVCTGMPAQVVIKSDSASTSYVWSPAAYLNCDTCGSVIINAPDTTTFTITGTNQWGCSTTGSMHINVDPLPSVTDSVRVNLCKGDNMNLSIGGGAARYAWTPALYLSDSSSASPVCTPFSSVTYSVDAYNTLGCSVHGVVAVNVGDSVLISLPPDTVGCAQGKLQLHAKLLFASDLGVQYSWTPFAAMSNPYIADPVVSLGDKSEVFTVVATSGKCAADTQQISVEVKTLPDLEVSSNVTTTPGAEVQVYADSHEELNYHWTSKDSISCPDCRITDVFPTATQVVYVEGTNSLGCSVTDSLIITVEGCNGKSIWLPNTFTPNGDGVDDKFYIRTTALSSLNYFRIFDAWGQQVFETQNISEGWDGTVNGRPAPIAVYVYELDGVCQDGHSVFKSGNVTALR